MKTHRALLWLAIPMLLVMGVLAFDTLVLRAAPGTPAQASTPAGKTAEEFFGLDRLYSFELTIAPSDFASMSPSFDGRGRGFRGFRGEAEYPKVPAVLRFQDQEWGRLLVRYKGNSSYMGAPTALKRSLKLEFDAVDSGRRFFGMPTLNLNNNAFDPSQMRESLAFDVFRRADIAAPRTAFAKVYLTVPGRYQREYAGLFTAVEQIDQTFFVHHWGQKVGVLVKPEDVQGLPDLGSEWNRYAEAYASKIKAKPKAAAQFMAFVHFINTASDDELVQHLHEYLDVDEFLRFLAIEVAIVNTDSPLAMNHNYWLTVHPKTGKVIWLPWDMNESFGGFRFGDVDLSLHEPPIPGMFPLADRLLGIPAFKRRYDELLRVLMSTNFTAARLDAEITRLAALIRPAVAADPSLSIESFERSVAESSAASSIAIDSGQFGFGHSGPPLRPFIHARVASVFEQLGKGVDSNGAAAAPKHAIAPQ